MNDVEIIDLFWSRSESAITELSNKYDKHARSGAKNILHNEEDTEECMADSYLGMWNTLPPKRPAVLPAFFAALTRNVAITRYRHNNAAKRKVIMEELQDYMSFSPAPDDEIEYAVEVINKYLSKCDKRSRVLFMRRYFMGESVAVAAKFVGITETYASVKLSRMRAELKKMLEKEGINI